MSHLVHRPWIVSLGLAASAVVPAQAQTAATVAPASTPAPLTAAGASAVPADAPLSSVVAITTRRQQGPTLPQLVESLLAQHTTGTLPGNYVFPLPNQLRSDMGAVTGLQSNVLVKWLDSLSLDGQTRFGANCDYIAYFGDGWDADWSGDQLGSAPQFKGSGEGGWLWVNHEYVSNNQPTLTSAPTGQHLTLAKFLQNVGVLGNDVTAATWTQADINTYVEAFKRQVGGSWIRIERNQNGVWQVIQTNQNQRFDATSNTLTRLTGSGLYSSFTDAQGNAVQFRTDHRDDGTDLPVGVLAGIHNDCSGGQSPWGTVISAEENVQGAYGDLETCWDSNQKFLVGRGFDPGSYIRPLITASTSGEFGRADSIQTRHGRDVYAYLIEIDPGQATTNYYDSVAAGGDGRGHAKLGAIGRARWENATFVTGPDWRLIDGEPIVIYTSDDRRGGRMYKFVSSGVYTEGMTRGEVRALLDEGRLYVSHFEDLDNTTGYTLLSTGEVPTADNPGQGRWILLSVDSTDVPPNAAALGQPNITVGEALRDVDYNGIGGFETQNDVLLALFTTANKLGTSELNRPEDLEWNPLDPSGNPKLYFAFTNHTGRTALDQNGVLVPPAVHSTQAPLRTDTLGSVFALEYLPGVSAASADTFDYYAVWVGRSGQGLYSAANPDNLMIDSQGRVWFGTDGNVGTNGTADAVYLIDQDPSHAAGQPGIVNPTFGEAIRVAATPADAEATGPALSSDERTLFLSVQHPGENTGAFPTSWPQGF